MTTLVRSGSPEGSITGRSMTPMGRVRPLADEVAHRGLDSPVGALLILATSDGVARVAFAGEDHDRVLEELGATGHSAAPTARRHTDDAARQLEEYFLRGRRGFDVPLDLRLASGFRREVVVALGGIAHGTTEAYAGLALRVGRPAAVRAAASACSHNPLPLLLPCHRVVRSDGTPGRYRGGSQAKVTLLALEAGMGE